MCSVILFLKVQRRLYVVWIKRLEIFSWTLKLVKFLKPLSSVGQSPTKKSLNQAGSPSRPLEDSMSDLCGFCLLFNSISWEFVSIEQVGNFMQSASYENVWFEGNHKGPPVRLYEFATNFFQIVKYLRIVMGLCCIYYHSIITYWSSVVKWCKLTSCNVFCKAQSWHLWTLRRRIWASTLSQWPIQMEFHPVTLSMRKVRDEGVNISFIYL